MKLLPILLWLSGVAGQLAAGPVALAQPAPAPSDVLLLTTGQELSGRVLAITPAQLTYLPTAPGAPADTARLPTTSVFLVRYANGTREVISDLMPAPPPVADATPPALLGLGTAQRLALGQHDAQRCYRASGPYWGTLGATLYLGPLLGLAPAIAIGSSHVQSAQLNAPQPLLLADAAYARGYEQQADRLKKRRTWGGYGVATAAYGVLIAALLASVH